MINYHQNNLNAQGEFIISHSNLNLLDPNNGGHPKKFYKAMTDPPLIENKNPSFEKGDLLHSWMEHKDSFIITDQTKPTPQVSALIEEFYKLYVKEKYKDNAVFLELLKQKSILQIEEVTEYENIFSLVNKRPYQNTDELLLFIVCIRFARTEAEYNATHKELTVLKTFKEALSYLDFLRESSGLIILSSSMRDILVNCVESIKNHPFANKLIFQLEGEHEKELFWQTTPLIGGPVLNRKGKLDKLIVYPQDKILIIPDLKTTSYDVSDFATEEGAYYKYNLGRQLTSYAEGFFQCNKQYNYAGWQINLFNIVVQTNGEYPTMVYNTSMSSMYIYRKQLVDLEELTAWHIQNSEWNLTKEEALRKGNEYIII